MSFPPAKGAPLPKPLVKREIIDHGLSFGAALAMVISWSVNHSILWAITHGFFSWSYVIYYALGYGHTGGSR